MMFWVFVSTYVLVAVILGWGLLANAIAPKTEHKLRVMAVFFIVVLALNLLAGLALLVQ